MDASIVTSSTEATKDVEQLIAWLLKYGRHTYDCVGVHYPDAVQCTCGWRQIRARLQQR